MAYEIPQQLAYKEKIMFGLTFKQLLYVFFFGAVLLLIMKRISLLEVKIVLSVFISIIGSGFVFFDLEEMILVYWRYLNIMHLQRGSPKLVKFFGIRRITDNCIVDRRGKKIAIIKVSTINFGIKPTKEKESIIASFQKFLNSLDFPTQVLMNTESINLERYLSALQKRVKTEELRPLFLEYRNYLSQTIRTNKITNRVFYLVVPEKNDLSIQTRICLDRLGGLNLKARALSTNEIKRLLRSVLGGDKKDIFPEFVTNKSTYLETGGKYQRIVCASGYPRYVESGFLDCIISSLGDFDVSLHLKPYPIEGMLIGLNRELQKQRSDLYSMQTKGITNPTLEIQYNDTRNTLADLQKGEERLFNVSLYINCKAESLAELNLLTKKVESELNSLMILPRVPTFKMLQGLKSIAPLGQDVLNFNRNITTKALSAFFPFTSRFLEADNGGVWLGLNRNNIPIIKDIFNLSNPNGLVLAQSGGGKSYFCKLLITRYLLNGTRVMVIDPQGEYKGVVSRFKGQTIDLSKDSDTIINPLDLMGHDYVEKRLSLMDLMKIMLGDLSDIQRAFIDKALTKTYERRGITRNPDTWDNEPPILGDLLKVLRQMEKQSSKLEQTTINSLANRLEMYVTGVFSFFNKQTNINFENNLVSFDIGKMPSQVKPATMFLVLDYIYMKMKSDLGRKILLIDESWSLLSRTEEAGYIFEIVKTCRKFNMGLLLINQEVEGLLDSKAGKSVLANSSYTMLMRQKPAVIDNICKTFHLSNSERNHLLTAGIGEGLLIMEDDHSEIKVLASPEEHKLITTNADEITETKTNQKSKKQKKVTITVDEHKRFFRESKVGNVEKKFLLEKGYKIAEYTSLVTNKKERFLLKPRHNESLTHLFVVYDTAEYLEKKGYVVEKYTTKKPDIVFWKDEKERYAIEVETGSVLRVKSRMNEKLQVLEEYDEWFFVLTDRNRLKEYGKYGESVDVRYLKQRLSKIRRQTEHSQSA